MGQLQGDTNRANNHYEISRTKKNENGRGYGFKRQIASPLLLTLVCATIIVVLSLLISSICIDLAALQLLWSEVMASLWSLVRKVFTPKSLLILLNVLIVSILALGHLQAKTDLTTNLAQPSSAHSVASSNNYTNHYPSISRQQSEISTPHEDGAIISIADDVKCTAPQTCMKYLEINSELNLLGTEIHDGNVHSDTHNYQENCVNNAIPPLNLLSSRRNIDSPEVQNKANEAPFSGIADGAADAQAVMRQGIGKLSANVRSRTAEMQERMASEPNDRSHSPLKTILKRGDTLEATWKAICERKRQSSPFKLHHDHHHHHQGSPAKSRNTLLDAVNNVQHVQRRQLLRTEREPFISHEELNAKVESFISRFHARIKIQREKSLLEFMEMVGRGTN